MKKKKIKNYLKIGVILLGISLFLINCNTDLDETTLKINSDITVKNLSFKDIQLNTKLLQKLERITSQEKSSSMSSKDTIYNSEYGFYININDVKYVESGGYNSYTFSITRDNPEDDKLENLLLSLNNQGNYDSYILKYDFTGEELNNLDENALNTRRTEYTPIDFNFSFKNDGESPVASRYVCVEVWTLVGISSPRTFEIESYEWVSTIECEYVAGAGVGTGTTGSGTTSGNDTSGGGTGTTGTSTGTTIISAPVLSPEAKMLDAFFENLTPEQEECLDSQLHKEIKTFLLANFDPNIDGSIAPKSNISSRLPTSNSTYTFADTQNFANLVLDNCGSQVDWKEKVILDSSFIGSELECIYNKLNGNKINPNFFQTMLNEFNNSDSSLTFSIGLTPNENDVAFTKGISTNGISSFEIISSNNTEKASNLDKMVTLSHELMHAFMFRSLEDEGLIEFNNIGQPVIINPTNLCENAMIIPNINLNTLNIKERWTYLLCEIYILNNNEFTSEWTHSLFNSSVFNIETYREKLEQLLIENHDWDSEISSTISTMQIFFGSNWKQKVAEYMSWTGLEDTPEFATWLNTQSSFVPTGSSYSNNRDFFDNGVIGYWTQNINVLNNCN